MNKSLAYIERFETTATATIISNGSSIDPRKFTSITPKALLQNKLDKAGDIILCNNKAKNAGIAVAMTRFFNAVSVQKNKPEWSSYFVTMPKQNFHLTNYLRQ